MAPSSIGRYTIIRPLGAGGMADVYLARDPQLNREVALKMPALERPSPDALARFRVEARAVARLEHAAIVPLYEYGDHEGRPFLVMRYMHGGSLADRIDQRRATLAEAVAVVDQIAAALDYAHAQGVIHRDVKPGNILFDDAGAAYLTDFGIARMIDAGGGKSLTQTGLIVGTVAYMSPEQALGRPNLDGRVDIYSLGIVLYEMLTGDIPYQADSQLQQAMLHVNAPIPSIRERRRDLPPGIQAVIERALAKEPAQRYASGAALAADLRRAAAGQAIARGPQPAKERSRGVPVWLMIAAVAVVAVVLGMMALGNDDRPPATSASASANRATPAGGGAVVAQPSPANEPTEELQSIAVETGPTSTVAPAPADTATSTPTQTATPVSLTPTAVVCPGAFPARLRVGDRARVINYQLNVREGPGTGYAITRRLDVGRTMDILEGPVCDDGQLWYRIISEEIVPRDGSQPYRAEGWLIEESDDDYYLEPIP
jgi:serine/threonine-protein kinase